MFARGTLHNTWHFAATANKKVFLMKHIKKQQISED
jgi:hypothetical protein